MAAEKARSIP